MTTIYTNGLVYGFKKLNNNENCFSSSRFHTNQISLVKFLQKKGLKVSFMLQE